MATIKQTIYLEDKMSSTLSKIQKNSLNSIKNFNTLSSTVKDLEKQLENAEKINPEIINTEMYAQAVQSLEQMKGELGDVANGTSNLANENNNLSMSMTEVNQSLELAKKGYNLLSGAIKEAIKLTDIYNNQFNAEFTAGASMSAMMGMSSSDIQEIYDYAAALQKVGVIGDEALISGAGIMSSAATSKEGLQGLMEAAANATVRLEGVNASQASYESTANYMRRALEGSASMLERNNILTKQQADYIDSINNKTKKEAELIRLVNANTNEANKVLANTAQGGLMQANNSLGDMQETLGKQVLPYLSAFKQITTQLLEPIVQWAAANSDWLIPSLLTLTAGLGGLIAVLTLHKIATFLSVGANAALLASLLPIVVILTGFVVILNLVANELSKLTGQSVSSVGLIMGALNVLKTFVQNLWIDFQNGAQATLNGIGIMFVSFGQLVVGVLNTIATAIDFVFGSNFSETTGAWLQNLENMGNAIIENPGYQDRKSYSEAFDKGYDFGANLFGEDNSMLKSIEDTTKLFDGLTTSDGAGGKALKTTSNDKLLTDEDIQLLLDVATRDYQLNYQQVTPNITVTFGDIRETADVDSVLDVVGTRIEEIINGDMEVVNG